MALAWAGLGPVSTARAGEYIYWACHTPSGQLTSFDGWTSFNTMNDLTWASPAHDCAAGGKGSIGANFVGAAGTNYKSGTGVGWSFDAPAGTRIGHVNLRRDFAVLKNGTPNEGDANNGTTGVVFYKNGFGYDGDHVVEACQRYTGCVGPASQRLAFDNDGPQSSIGFEAGCYGDVVGTCGGVGSPYRASASVQWGEIHLIDSSNPTVSSVGGSAIGGAALAGRESLTFNAADIGGGLWQAAVTLDGTPVYPRTTLDANDGRCVVAPYYGGAEFGYPVPCKPSLTVALPVDVTAIANGSHLLEATVYDAANNATVVVSTRVTVANPAPQGAGPPPAPALNGGGGDRLTARFTSSKKPRTITASYGSVRKVTGRLVDAHRKAITGASIDVLERSGVAGSTPAKTGTLTTDAKGRFTYRPTTLADHEVTLAFAATVGGVTYLDQRVLKVHVVAGVTLKASRSTASRGQKVTFSGVVSAGTLPKLGVRVAIKALQHGRWSLAAVPRTDATGHFKWSHRFRNASRFGFRAYVLEGEGLQVRPGSSHLIHVTVR